eukprot:m.42400 g.42400  ORF g.42400 m.42400 type:complete len:990 (+) comp6091_c0_seq2:157-3126(+)
MAGPGAAYRRGGSRSSAQTRHTVSRKSPGSLLQAMSDLFDGAYRSSREISLRGASTQTSKNAAVRLAQQARAARQAERRRCEAASRIQAATRAFLTVERLRTEMRSLWDTAFAARRSQDIPQLLGELLFFFRPTRDVPRMMEMIPEFLAYCQTPLLDDPARAERWCRNGTRFVSLLIKQSVRNKIIRCALALLETNPNAVDTMCQAWIDAGLLRLLATVDLDEQAAAVSLLQFLLSQKERRLICLREFGLRVNSHVLIGLLGHQGVGDFFSGALLDCASSCEPQAIFKLLCDDTRPATLRDTALALQHLFSEPIVVDPNATAVYCQILAQILLELKEADAQELATYRASRGVDEDDYDSDDEEEAAVLDSQHSLTYRGPILSCLASSMHLKRCLVVLDGASQDYMVAFCNLIEMASDYSPVTQRVSILHTLQTDSNLLSDTWKLINLVNFVEELRAAKSATTVVRFLPVFRVFVAIYTQVLYTQDDEEFRDQGHLSLEEVIRFSAAIRDILVNMFWVESPFFQASWAESLKSSLVRLVRQLEDRDVRLHFCPPQHWLASDFVNNQIATVTRDLQPAHFRIMNMAEFPSQAIARTVMVLRNIPFVARFEVRANIFRRLVSQQRSQFPFARSRIRIQRSQLYHDAFTQLSTAPRGTLTGFRVTMVNEQGLDEAGIDGGGLLREFLNDVLKAGFDPEMGLFCATSERELYPNPYPSPPGELAAMGHAAHYRFLGRILGRALQESLLQELPFAAFFLRKLLGQTPLFNDLASLDPELHRNLLYLKRYEGNLEDLDLSFSAADNTIAGPVVYDLEPNGRDHPVTSQNIDKYLVLIAGFRLNRQLRSQSAAFAQGLTEVIDPEWLKLFDAAELQKLISGDTDGIDIDDLQANTVYAGEYNPTHPTIEMFWEVMREFSQEHRCALVKFVTSCSRPPLLGFEYLHPKLCIHSVPSTDRLPTAATCMNLLKLPTYDDKDVLRERLLYAIHSGAGFELS